MRILLAILTILCLSYTRNEDNAWIRINQLGYTPGGVKVAVWCSKNQENLKDFQLIDVSTGKIVYSASPGKPFGAYGPFKQTCRLNFSSFEKPGRYYLKSGSTRSPEFIIGNDVYEGAAGFCLRYMRQQRTGFNPFLKDSCHTHDGYVLYGQKAGIKDSTYIDVVGGWHDASDYLQYSTTSANATYHLLMAYRDFPQVFSDDKLSNGLDGKNNIVDVMDEARWGLDWLLKMHPRNDWMFNQIADDRDHMGMRIPGQDSFYGKGYQRPVYFVSGEPQQRGKFMNITTGNSSIAGKFSSAFALGSLLFKKDNPGYSELLFKKSLSAYKYGKKKQGFTQTASVRSPYIYNESNWTDDMELAATMLSTLTNDVAYRNEAYDFAKVEQVTPWLGADTAHHYQWYPFINIGHYELAKQLNASSKKKILDFYNKGIRLVWQKAKQNAFYRGIPFIWCSNNLTTSFAIQCYWYRQLTGSNEFNELEQANFDWLFGCNPWGTSMVYGLPGNGDTPVDPHSAFTHLGNYPIDGGLVDGPVYGSIYRNLIGINLKDPDEYAGFQSDLAVYHDDYGDYSTNEPTMDGTAALIYLLAAKEAETEKTKKVTVPSKEGFSLFKGAIIRGDSTKKNIALVFTGHEYADGGAYIAETLKQSGIKASFFFTGKFLREKSFRDIITTIQKDGHYIGPHSDQHLLYCDWSKRDSLLVTRKQFVKDLNLNLAALSDLGIAISEPEIFLPPYEWYNDTIAAWTDALEFTLINFTPGTLTHADYTTQEMKNYRTSEQIYNSVIQYEKSHTPGLNGFILLLHIGTDPKRTDKFYLRLPTLIKDLKSKGYQFQTVRQLLSND